MSTDNYIPSRTKAHLKEHSPAMGANIFKSYEMFVTPEIKKSVLDSTLKTYGKVTGLKRNTKSIFNKEVTTQQTTGGNSLKIGKKMNNREIILTEMVKEAAISLPGILARAPRKVQHLYKKRVIGTLRDQKARGPLETQEDKVLGWTQRTGRKVEFAVPPLGRLMEKHPGATLAGGAALGGYGLSRVFDRI